jgi:hypothetical protein
VLAADAAAACRASSQQDPNSRAATARRPLAAGTLLGEFCGLVSTGAVSQFVLSPAQCERA